MKIITALLFTLLLVGCASIKPKYEVVHCIVEPKQPIMVHNIVCGYYVEDGIRKAGCRINSDDFIKLGTYFQQLEAYYNKSCVCIKEVKE